MSRWRNTAKTDKRRLSRLFTLTYSIFKRSKTFWVFSNRFQVFWVYLLVYPAHLSHVVPPFWIQMLSRDPRRNTARQEHQRREPGNEVGTGDVREQGAIVRRILKTNIDLIKRSDRKLGSLCFYQRFVKLSTWNIKDNSHQRCPWNVQLSYSPAFLQVWCCTLDIKPKK